MGVLPGWWLGEPDGRYPEPYVPLDRWDNELRQSGFRRSEMTTYDGYLNYNIVAKPAVSPTQIKGVNLLFSASNPGQAEEVAEVLRTAGNEVALVTIEDIGQVLPEQDFVSILDMEKPFLHNIEESQFEKFQLLLSSLEKSEKCMLWVTGAAQVRCSDPRYGMINGVSRVIRTELGINFATLELEAIDNDSIRHIPRVLGQCQRRISEPDINPTSEWAVSGGKVLSSRYHYIRIADELGSIVDETPDTAYGDWRKKLEQQKPGLAETLCWRQLPPHLDEIDANHVDVRMKAVGLNFKVGLRICLKESSGRLC